MRGFGTRWIGIGLLWACLVGFAPSLQGATPLILDTAATGLSQPLFLTFPPGDSSRLFVIQRGGIIRIIKNGTLVATPFLNINSLITTTGSEQGLLGLAFDPQYATNRYFYLNYSRKADGATIVSRFQCSAGNPDSASLVSELQILEVLQPFSNHNGGMMAFGPDGYLYIGLGDGGSGGDPGNRAQDSTTLLGKIIRIDVSVPSGYAIPPSNPFVGRPGWRGEIWAYGVRNPWRFSFDRQTGDLFIGDVGQGNWEEIDFQSSLNAGGLNYGWRLKEGTHCYNPSTNCDTLVGLTEPIIEYSHSFGCSVTGGYVYRGCAVPDLVGTYFYGDYCLGNIWSLMYNGSTVSNFTNRTAELNPGSLSISSFGEDYYGEMYIIHYGGSVYKIVPDGVPSACNVAPCCVGSTGNVNMAGSIDLSDLSILIAYLTIVPRPSLPCPDEANIDASGGIDLTDLALLVSHLVSGNNPFVPCP